MVVAKVNYMREFKSKTHKENTKCLKIIQATAEEDEDIRKEIRERFDCPLGSYSGFDGILNYNYTIIGKPNAPLNSIENITYTAKYFITKAGAPEDIEKPCELESFLLSKEFIKEEKH